VDSERFEEKWVEIFSLQLKVTEHAVALKELKFYQHGLVFKSGRKHEWGILNVLILGYWLQPPKILTDG